MQGLKIRAPLFPDPDRNAPLRTPLLVTLAAPDGTTARLLLTGKREEAGWPLDPVVLYPLVFDYWHPPPFGLGERWGEHAWCVTATPVSIDGEVGPVWNLGCVDPNDPDDPRLYKYSPAGGCHAAAPSLAGAVLGLVLLGFHRGSRRRRRGSVG